MGVFHAFFKRYQIVRIVLFTSSIQLLYQLSNTCIRLKKEHVMFTAQPQSILS